MGRRTRDRQAAMWAPTTHLPRSASHPFYRRLNELLREHGFDDVVEGQCARFYAETMGRPGLPPGIYFRLLLVGYFEGIDSERGICLACGRFVGATGFPGRRLGRCAARSLDDFAHASVDRPRSASCRLYVGAAVPAYGRPGSRGRRSASTPRRSKPTRRCAASSGETAARATRSF